MTGRLEVLFGRSAPPARAAACEAVGMRVPPVPSGLDRAAGWAWRLLAVAAAAIAALALLWYFRVIVLPTMVALTIAPALTPVANLFRRLRLRRPAAAVALVTGLAVVAGLVAIVTLSVLAQYDDLADAVSDGVDEVTSTLEDEPFNLSLENTRDFDATLRDSWDAVSGYLVVGLQAGIGLVTGLVLAIALLYFILRDGAAFWAWILRRFAPPTRPLVDRSGRNAWAVLGGFVRGTALIAAIDATLIGIGLWILGVPVAFALAVLVFLGAFIPFVGAFVSGLVAVLVAFADGGWDLALLALALVAAVQLVEGNFLQPIIQSRTVDLHPAVILLAVAAGGSLFGILGAYLAVPVTAVIFAVVASVEAETALPLAAEPAPEAAPSATPPASSP
jgi:predicted PurR-regulated permease PerM